MAKNPFSDPNFGASASTGNSEAGNPFADPEFGKEAGIGARIKQGAGRAIDSARTALTDDPNKIAQIASEQAASTLPQSPTQARMAREFAPYVERANKAEGVIDNVTAWGSAALKRGGQLLANPGEAAKMIAEQAPNSAPALAGGYVGMKAGAAIGTAVAPGPGTIIGGLLGSVAGGFAGSYGLEKGASMQEQVQKEAQARNIDIRNQAEVAKMVAQKQPEFDATAQRKAVGTAGTDAVLNTLTMGVAGVGSRALAKEALSLSAAVKAGTISAADATAKLARLQAANAARNTIGAKAARGAGVVGAEMGGESLSEAAGQMYAHGRVDAGEVIDEGLLGLGTGGAMALGSKAFNKAAGIVDQDGITRDIEAAQSGLASLGPAFTTSPGAADPTQPGPTPPAAPIAPDWATSPGAAAPNPYGGIDFTREVDTSGLSLADPADTIASRLKPSEVMGLNPAAGALSREVAAFVDAQPFTEITPIESRPGIGAQRRIGEQPIIDVDAREVIDPQQTIAARLAGPSQTAPIQQAVQQLPYNPATQGDSLADQAPQAIQAATQRTQAGAAQADSGLNDPYAQAWDSLDAESRASVARSAGSRGSMARNVASKGWGDLSPNLRASISTVIESSRSPGGVISMGNQPQGTINVGNTAAPQTGSVPAAAGSPNALAQGERGAGLSGNGDGVGGQLDGTRQRVTGSGAGEAGLAPVAGRAGVAPALTQGAAPILQNRNRSNPSSIAQMQGIAADPDYGRLGFSRDFANGAPVVAGGTVPADQFGRSDVAVASDGRRIPVQYAVVEASDVLASNQVDGTPNADYGNQSVTRIRAIAGNGRIAGLQRAYGMGTSDGYAGELLGDALHGVSPDVIRSMRQPVLVRVMPVDQVTQDIGDVSNTTGNLSLSPVEQANNDAQRVSLDALQFSEDGAITSDTVRQFVRAMPQAEQGGLIDTNGQPTKQAVDRINAAVFARAYGNDQLIRLFAQAQDPEARNVLSALAQVAPKMARLEGAGSLDIRDVVTQAAEIAVNARREGRPLANAASQIDMTADPMVGEVLKLFARNARTVRPVVDALGAAADFAYTEANKPADDMFGAVPKATRSDVLGSLSPQNEQASQANLEQPAGGKPVQVDAVQPGADAGAATDAAATQAGRPAEAQEVADDGTTIKPGKGLIKDKYLAEVDGDGVPGGPWDSETQARAAAEAWKQTMADRATESAAERNRRDRIAEKFRRGEAVTNAEIESLGLKTGTSDVRWFFSTAANLFGLKSRDIRPIVKDMIREGFTDMGAKREYVPTRQALEAVARSANPQAANVSQPTNTLRGRIEDSGQVLEGARKMYAANYAAKLSEGMDMDVAAVPLSKSWPEPDYQRLLDEGTDPWAVAFMHAVRDEIPTKPSKGWKLKGWVQKVELLRDLASRATDGRNTPGFIQTTLAKHANLNGWHGRVELYEAVGHGMSLKGVTLEAGEYGIYGGEKFSPPKKIWAVNFPKAGSSWGNDVASGDTKAEAIEKFKAWHAKQGGAPAKEAKLTSFDIYTYRSKPGVIVGKRLSAGKSIDLKTFETVKEAREYKANNQDELERLLAQAKEEPAERRETNAPRVGDDHRNGADVTSEQFREAFGFRGEQFGESMPQTERQANMNMAYDALMDLAGVVGIPPRALSLNGELGLAFGARGHGGKRPAAAHYEQDTTGAVTPNRVVINLTRKNGAGSLAHEWFHAVDNYFGRMRGMKAGFLTESHADRGEGVRPEMVNAFRELMGTINRTGMKERSSKLDATRIKDYWSTGLEMAARSFESYVIAKLQDQNKSNDYLANVVNETLYAMQGAYPYPSMGEMTAIRAAFDNFFQTVQTKETEDGNVAMFSRRSESGNLKGALYQRGQTITTRTSDAQFTAAQQITDTIAARWKNAPADIIVARNMQDASIPEAVRKHDAELKSQGATGEPRGFIYKGKVYLLSDQLKTTSDVIEVLFHESLGHYGLRGVFGDSLKSILQQVGTMRRADVVAKAREYGLFDTEKVGENASDRDVWASMTDKQRLDAAEEVLAEMSQTRPDLGFVKRAISAIRNWLRANVPGFQNLRMKDADIVQAYILPARGWVERGRGAAVKDANPKFDRGDQAGRQFSDIKDHYVRYPTKPPSGMSMDDARTFMRERRASMEALADAYAEKAEGLLLPIRGNGGFWGVTREARPDGDEWRVTRFDSNMEPMGHEAHRTARTAVEDLLNSVDVKRLGEIPQFSRSADQTQTEAFNRRFGDSKVAAGSQQATAGNLEQGPGLFDLTVPEDGNQLREIKTDGTTVVLNAKGRYFNPEGVIEVASVRTPATARGNGKARRALETLVKQADAEGVTLKLDASPLDKKTNIGKLVAFYESLGFERTGRSNNVAGEPEMIRRPKALNQSPQSLPPTIEIGGKQRPTTNSNGQPIASTEEGVRNFWQWFGDSKAVDADGRPLVMYHGTSASENGDAFTSFDTYASNYGLMGQGGYFTADPEVASSYTTKGKGSTPTVYKVFLSIQNPIDMDAKADPAKWQEKFDGIEDYHEGGDTNESWYRAAEDWMRDQGVSREEGAFAMQESLISMGFDGITHIGGGRVKSDGVRHRVYIAFDPEQIKSATGNNGNFDPADPRINFSRTQGAKPAQPTAPASAWGDLKESAFDDVIFKMQDKMIDLKRVVESITKSVGAVADNVSAYLQEELFHGRAASRVAEFGNREMKPLMNQMRLAGLTLEDVEEFLHARHAKEANAVIAQRNPGNADMQDGGSGMTNADADAYFANLTPGQRSKLEAAAKKVDAIIADTRKLYVQYGLEDQAVVDGWTGMFKSYIPLMRENKDGGMGIGQGFSVKGKEVKGRTGSKRKVVNIMANVMAQREKVIVRGEKNRVAQALVGLAWANPNKAFWEVRSQAPTERVYDDKLKKVVDRPDPMFKSRDNVLSAKVKDSKGNVTEQFVVFNEDNPRAVRLASAMKNLDAGNLEGLLGVSAKITRYFSSINTQYNPVFGVVNLVRDVQGAMVNLAATPLAGQQAKIAKDTISALSGIYGDIRKTRKGGQATSPWAKLWEQMQEDGGTTGYRELFKTSADREASLKAIINPDAWMDSKWGKVFTADGKLKVPMSVAKKGKDIVFDWLSDYNEAMENGVRLAAYKAALDKGMSRQQAASLSKNLTVNFNRKGQVGMQAGAVYAFFNAAMQGTARIGQTLFDMEGGDIKTIRLSSVGKKVVYGGVLLGVMQALALSAAGFDDEDPPEFLRERSLIIPTGWKTYISIPMPLGLHVIPGLGRHATEFALSGFSKPAERAVSVVGMLADAFNPIGNAGLSMQTVAPTALDPFVALSENRDWTGKPIARTSFNKAEPGHNQWKDTATGFSKTIAEAINWLSGGNEYVAGAFSPTPDQIDYLIAQVGGGVAREVSKAMQTGSSITSGEELPTYKMPLLGRFVGSANGQASQGSAFYANLNKLNALETEIKGLRKDGRYDEAAALVRERPESSLIAFANKAERDVQKLRRDKRELIANDASREDVRAKEDQITSVMTRLNELTKRRAESVQ